MKDQVGLMEDDPEVERLQILVERDLYPFGYDGTFEDEPDPGCDLGIFQADAKVIAD